MARPLIPPSIRAIVWARAQGKCACCGEKVLAGEGDIDHRPPLGLRERVPRLGDKNPEAYVPHANDPDYLDLMHGAKSGKDCHKRRTFGEATRRGDVSDIAKATRIAPEHEAMRRKLLAKAGRAETEPETVRSPKQKIKSRPMPGTKASGIRIRMNKRVEKW